jgi:hypothetical protein
VRVPRRRRSAASATAATAAPPSRAPWRAPRARARARRGACRCGRLTLRRCADKTQGGEDLGGGRDPTQQELEFGFQERVRAPLRWAVARRADLPLRRRALLQLLYNGDTDHVRMIPSKARELISLTLRKCGAHTQRRRALRQLTRGGGSGGRCTPGAPALAFKGAELLRKQVRSRTRGLAFARAERPRGAGAGLEAGGGADASAPVSARRCASAPWRALLTRARLGAGACTKPRMRRRRRSCRRASRAWRPLRVRP